MTNYMPGSFFNGPTGFNAGYDNSFGYPTPYNPQPFYGSDPFAGYALPLHDQHCWYPDSPVLASKVVYCTITKTEKGFEARKLSKRDGAYIMRERNGREVRIGKLKAKRKVVVNHRPDDTFDAMFVECELEGETEAKWIVIPYRAFIKRDILQYLHGFHRNVDCPDKYIIAAFYQELLEGDDTKFLDLPQRSGWQRIGDKMLFASAASVIPQLAPYYPPDILGRRLIATDKKLGDAAEDLAQVMPKDPRLQTLAVISVTSVLLYYFARAGLTADHLFVIEVDGESTAQVASALLKNLNFDSTAIPPLLQSKTALQRELDRINDGMAIFRTSSLIEERRELARCADVLVNDLAQSNGIEAPSCHLIAVLAEHPGALPPELPAYHLSLIGCPAVSNLPALRQALGVFESALINLLSSSNPDENLMSWALDRTKHLPKTERNFKYYPLQRMLQSTAAIMQAYRVIQPTDGKELNRFLRHQDHSMCDADQEIVNDFRKRLSTCISGDILRLTSQTGQPFFTNPVHTAIVDDRYINLTQAALDCHIIPHLTTTKRRNKLLHALAACGKLHCNNNFKRNIDVEVAAGITETFSVYSVPQTLLTSSAAAKVNATAHVDHLFHPLHVPINFLPIVQLSDTQIAGRVVDAATDEAESIYASGQTRSGKTFFLLQQALFRTVVLGSQVVIFDQTGAFSWAELCKHLPDNVVDQYFTHFELGKQGLTVDLLSLEGCGTLPEKKNRLFSIFSVAGRITGEVQGKVLRKQIARIAKAIENGELHDLPSTLSFFDDADPDQLEIKSRLESVFADLEGLPMSKRNWGEFLNTKKIVVISTADDGIRKSAELIDMLLASLYAWKQRHRHSRCTIVLDEIEDLILEKDGPISTILRKGGKHGLSMLLASQEFSAEKDKLGKIIGNCGLLAVFRPKEADLSILAKHLGVTQSALARLEQGEFFAVGGLYSKRQGKNRKTVIAGKTYPAAEYLKQRKQRYPFKRD